MATYAVSDLHGQYRTFEKGLRSIGFSDSDMLYVIGDAIDRDPADHRIEHQKAYAGIEYREYFSYHVHRCIVSYPT